MERLRGLEAVLFDADGTLIDTYNMILRSMRYTVQTELHETLSDAELMHGVGKPLFDQFVDFCHGDEVRASELVPFYREHMARTHDDLIRAFPDALSALEKLRDKGYRMAVVTSKPHDLAERGLSLTHLAPYFEFIIAADDYPKHKPHPGPILHAAKRLSIAPDACAYVGDSPYDIISGNAAKAQTVAALWGMFSRDVLQKEAPFAYATSLSELADAL